MKLFEARRIIKANNLCVERCNIEAVDELPYFLQYPPLQKEKETRTFLTDCNLINVRILSDGRKTQEIDPHSGNFLCECWRNPKKGKFILTHVWIKKRTNWEDVVKEIQEHLEMRNYFEQMEDEYECTV